MLVIPLLFIKAGHTMVDARPPNLSRLLGVSDPVVYERIAEVGRNAFGVDILSVMVGAEPLGGLEMIIPRRWRDVPCWAPHEVSQFTILFLERRVVDRGLTWCIAAPFRRGEFPTGVDFVYLSERYEGFGEPRPRRVHRIEAFSI